MFRRAICCVVVAMHLQIHGGNVFGSHKYLYSHFFKQFVNIENCDVNSPLMSTNAQRNRGHAWVLRINMFVSPKHAFMW